MRQVFLTHCFLGGILLVVGTSVRTQEKAVKTPEAGAYALKIKRDDAKQADALENKVAELRLKGDYTGALAAARDLLKTRLRLQGMHHWQTTDARFLVRRLEKITQLPERARAELGKASNLAIKASALYQRSRYADARPLYERIADIYQRHFGEDDPDTLANQNLVAVCLSQAGEQKRAEPLYRKALAVCQKALGEEHPETAKVYGNLAICLSAQAKNAEAEPLARKALTIREKLLGKDHPDTASSYVNVAATLNAQGKYAAAEPFARKALAIWTAVLGEEDSRTATGHNELGFNLYFQGKYAEAELHCRKALTLREKIQGEEDPTTASSYNNVAATLKAQGKYGEAGLFLRKALAIWKKTLGEEHPQTALGYNNVGYNLSAEGKYAEAEPLYRKALAIWRKVLGEEHPNTALGYNNVGAVLDDQGRHTEAEPLCRKALAIRKKVLGEEHPYTAITYDSLASNLYGQGRFREGEALVRTALAILKKVLGEEHPSTVASYNGLARGLDAQGKPSEAEALYRKALAIRRKIFGEQHLDTAQSYNNVAAILDEQGKHAEAEPLRRQALAICQNLLGDNHPHTVLACNGLAFTLHTQGKYEAAQTMWLNAARHFAVARLCVHVGGLERAAFMSNSRWNYLVTNLARSGKPVEAWQHFEEHLARGTWDELAGRLRRSPQDRARQMDLVHQLARLDQLLERTRSAGVNSDFKKRRDEWLTRQRQLQDELTAFTQALEKKYGPVAGQVFHRATIQNAIPADAALVAWIDVEGQLTDADPNGEHWGLVLRRHGLPAWVRLHGTGANKAWIKADSHLPAKLRAGLRGRKADWKALATALRQQRLAPLTKHLQAAHGLPAVKRLIVLPSVWLAGVPVEVFAHDYTVSYALSGTLFAHLKQQPRIETEGLLMLADPVFERSGAAQAAPLVPPGGILLTHVLPGSNAARGSLRTGDVLLRYAGRKVNSQAELDRAIAEQATAKEIAVTLWRAGTELERRVQPGSLGVILAREPAPQAIALRQKIDHDRLVRGDADWLELPGTRYEAAALRKLFGSKSTKLLTDSQASEQTLDELARKGELGRYRYVHLATHAEADERFPLRSAVILARDHLPDAFQQWEAGLPAYDGRLTAEEILSTWNLKADLVTLSACETALGKYERGEGHVGFAQALILSGSRSVCLSLWKVDDAATALLMDRFYHNLLNHRADGTSGRMTKAEALAEAKSWLRNLTRPEAAKRIAALTNGVSRGTGRKTQPRPPVLPPTKDEGQEARSRPYDHPYYWAAFVLIGES